MQSIIKGSAPSATLEKSHKPWEKVTWPQQVEQCIYKAWGDYYASKRRENFAKHYYDKALDIFPEDYETLHARSVAKRRAANIDSALQDSQLASAWAKAAQGNENARINLGLCDTLYEGNRFEANKIALFDNIRRFTGNKTAAFLDRQAVVEENILDATGMSYGMFAKQNAQTIAIIAEMIKSERKIDNRLLWKVLQEAGECDVLSTLEKKEELVSPLEAARRKRAFAVYNQVFLQRPWIDVLYLKSLKRHPSFTLKQNCQVSKYLRTVLSGQYSVIIKFLKMLEARSPLYCQRTVNFPNKMMREKYHQSYLYRVQNQTRRNMISILRQIRVLRRAGNIKKLAAYIEQVMGDYAVIKTHRIMPWKFEFINDVYNILGLAYVQQYKLPANFNSTAHNAIYKLLRMPINKTAEVQEFVFGDKSTYINQSATDPQLALVRKLIARLEKRLLFAQHHLERSYLLFTIAQYQLDQNRYDECCYMARKAIKEAESCGNKMWAFLSRILIFKSHIALKKIERAKEELENATELALDLKQPYLIAFVEMCSFINEQELLRRQNLRITRNDYLSGRSNPSYRNSMNYSIDQISEESPGIIGSEGNSIIIQAQ